MVNAEKDVESVTRCKEGQSPLRWHRCNVLFSLAKLSLHRTEAREKDGAEHGIPGYVVPNTC